MTSQRLPDRLDETIQRIDSLTADTPRQWGKMTLPQTLGHLQQPFEVAADELKLKRGIIGLLFGKWAKKKMIDTDVPFRRNGPTDPRLLRADADEFERERARLVELVKAYGEHGPRTAEPHPFFGPLTREDWDRLLWKHLDHHLRQFGV